MFEPIVQQACSLLDPEYIQAFCDWAQSAPYWCLSDVANWSVCWVMP